MPASMEQQHEAQELQVIGILTLDGLNNDNYGAFMQAWALKQALTKVVAQQKQAAHATGTPAQRIVVGLIKHSSASPAQIARQRSLQFMAQRPTSKLKEDRKLALQLFRHELARLKRFAAFSPSLRIDLPPNTPLKPEQLKLVIGSDWVWYFDQKWPVLPLFLGDLPQFQECKRYAYAASFGIARPEDPAYQSYAPYLNAQWAKFRAISLREPTWLTEFERLNLNLPLGSVTQVVDPALLLTRADYQPLVEQPLSTQPYILIYSLPFEHKDEDVHALLDVLTAYVEQSGTSGLKIVDISKYHILGRPQFTARLKEIGLDYEFHYDTGPAEFVNWVAHAQLLLTPSFHGLMYSLIFNTPFCYFILRAQDPRLVSLEQLYDIEPLKLVPGRSFDLTAFTAARAHSQKVFEEQVAQLRAHSYQILNSIIQD